MAQRRLAGSMTSLLPLAGPRAQPPARVRVVVYVTRVVDGLVQVLVFDHRDVPEAGTQVPRVRCTPASVRVPVCDRGAGGNGAGRPSG